MRVSSVNLRNMSRNVGTCCRNTAAVTSVTGGTTTVRNTSFITLVLRNNSPGNIGGSVSRLVTIIGRITSTISYPLIMRNYGGIRGSTRLLPGITRTLRNEGTLVLSRGRRGCGTVNTTTNLTCGRVMNTRSTISVGLTGRLGIIAARLNMSTGGVIVGVNDTTINCKCRCMMSAVSHVGNTTLKRGSGVLRVPVVAPMSTRA